MTMLWHSNGGRDYAPWSGRHLHCLGIEDGIATAFLDPKVAAGLGDLVMLKPDTAQDLRHITGCIAWPSGEPILSVEIIKDQLVVTGDQGAQRHLPILGDFLAL